MSSNCILTCIPRTIPCNLPQRLVIGIGVTLTLALATLAALSFLNLMQGINTIGASCLAGTAFFTILVTTATAFCLRAKEPLPTENKKDLTATDTLNLKSTSEDIYTDTPYKLHNQETAAVKAVTSILHKKLNLPTVNRQPLGINKVAWNNIFTHLDDKSLVMLSRTEKTLYSLLEDYWKAKVIKLSKERGFETPVDVTSWSQTYARFSGKTLQAAAKKDAINCLQTLQGPTDSATSVAVHGNTIISGSDDNTIKVWDIKTGLCLQTLQGHTNSVTSVAVQGDTIISGSSDKTIKIWDLKTGACLQTLQGHTSLVRSIAIQGDTIISGSSDKTIKIWDLKTGACLHTLKGHTDRIRSVAIQGDTIISGCYDNIIKAWDIKTGACLQTLQGHTNSVTSVAIQGDTIISGSFDKTIKVWDIKAGACLQTLKGHTHWVYSVAIQGDTIISGSDDKTIKIWDIKTGVCLKTLLGHTNSVRSVAVQGNTIISGSEDKTIKVWSY